MAFAWLRIIGATTVVVDHSSPLIHPERLTVFPAEWQMSPGYIALMGFFAMSGYQISDSWARDPSWWRYSCRRVLRIMPPLMVVVMVTAFVIGPLVTVLDQSDYWSSDQTWRYVVMTTALFPLQHLLPGVFVDNPYPWSVNGSLWTLPMEAVGYVIVLLAGLAAACRAPRALLFAVLFLLMVLDARYQATFGYPGTGGSLVEVPIGSMVSFLVPFVIGVILFAYRDRIPLRPGIAIALLPIWLALHWTPVDRFVLPVMAGYGAIVLAHHWPRSWQAAGPWVYGSYGMYIWAFPIQQVLVHAGIGNQWMLMALAVPLSYLAGLASWRWVEEPTQRLRYYLRAGPKRAPAGADAGVLPRVPPSPTQLRPPAATIPPPSPRRPSDELSRDPSRTGSPTG